MTISVVNSLRDDRWRAFLEQHPERNVYHAPEMLRAFARVEGHRPVLWAAVDEAGWPLALLSPVNVTLMNGLLRPFTTRAVSYGGVLAAPGPEGEAALRTLLSTYKREAGRGAVFTELRHLSDASRLQPVLHACGFEYERHLNFLLDLRVPEEALWRKLTKSCQQSVRTARNKGTTIEALTDKAALPGVYELLKIVYARAQVPLAPLALFEAAFDELASHGMLQLWVARAEGRAIAVCLLLAYGERVIYWYGGLDRRWAAYCPMEALLWHAIQWARSQGHSIFDFGGAGRPEEEYGPRKFKAKFGGELVEFGRNVLVHSPLRMQLSRSGYQLLRRVLYGRSASQATGVSS